MHRWKIATYLALAFGLAWGLAFAFFAGGGSINSVAFVGMAVGYMFTPAIAAVVTQRLIWKGPMSELGLRAPRWHVMIVAWLAPLLLVFVAMGFSLLLPNVSFGGLDALYANVTEKLSAQQLSQLHAKLDHSALALPGVLPALSVVQALVAGATINAVAALGEELGWRGFLLHEVRGFGFWRASFLIGVVWGLWHLPLIARGYNYPGHPFAGPVMMTLLTTLLSPVIVYVRWRAGSVFAAAVFHGTFNAAAGLVLFLRGGNPMTTGILGGCGLLTIALADVALWLYLRQRPDPFSMHEPARIR